MKRMHGSPILLNDDDSSDEGLPPTLHACREMQL